ncbi:MAG TPA: hypothetical protein VHD56_05315 [Tepidisphaeraceae bacterium]|nr:hypothetical protein [Tepidisphaeraceae bacterium]
MHLRRILPFYPLLAGLLCATCSAGPLDDLVNTFLRISNERTPYGVTDGNPSAATAVLANDAFDHFGLRPLIGTTRSNWEFGMDSSYRRINTSPIHSDQYDVDLYGAYRFSDRFLLTLSLPTEYRDTHSLAAYIGGANVGLSIALVPKTSQGISWTITPWGSAIGVGASSDLAQGGLIAGGGATSSLMYTSGPWRFSMGNQVGYDWGAPIGYGKLIDFKQNISQIIVKNGVRAEYDVNSSLYIDASAAYTDMLNDAYTDNYLSLSAGAGLRFGDRCDLHLEYVGDYAHGYNAGGLSVSFRFVF